MLILTRKVGESLHIGDDVRVTIIDLKGNQIRIGIAAPPTMRIYREEIYQQIQDENRSAAVPEGDIPELPEGFPMPKIGGVQPRGEGSRKLGVTSSVNTVAISLERSTTTSPRSNAPQSSVIRRKSGEK